MIDMIISKTIIKENNPKEYENLANIILESPIKVYPYESFQQKLKEIIKFNKKQLKNKKYAIFYNLKTISIANKNYKIPSLEKLISFLNEKYKDKALTSLILAESLDQALLYYIGFNNGK